MKIQRSLPLQDGRTTRLVRTSHLKPRLQQSLRYVPSFTKISTKPYLVSLCRSPRRHRLKIPSMAQVASSHTERYYIWSRPGFPVWGRAILKQAVASGCHHFCGRNLFAFIWRPLRFVETGSRWGLDKCYEKSDEPRLPLLGYLRVL